MPGWACYNKDMVEQLFGSKTRVKLLQLFYSNPNRSFYVREITRKIDEQINSVRRELANLLSIGIITSDNTNNKLYYEVNQKFEYFDPMQIMFGGGSKKRATSKTKATSNASEATEPADNDDELKALGHVELAVYTGQFTRDESTGIDLLLVGDVNMNAVTKYVSELEAKEGKDIRYAVMKPADFKYRSQIKDRFVTQLISAKKQVLVDEHGLLG